MKKLLSAVLALTVAVTSFSCTVFGGISAGAMPANQPTGADDLNGTVTISTLDDFKNNFSYDAGVQAQLTGTDDFYYLNGETSDYYWKANGYTAAVTAKGRAGYFTGIEESKLQTVKYTTEFLTAANGYSDFGMYANGKKIFAFAPGQTANSGYEVLALRPAVFGGSANGAHIAVYVVPFADDEITTTDVYNNGGTSKLSYTMVVMNYYGTGKHAVVTKNTAATDYFDDGNTYYDMRMPARDVDGKICQFGNNQVSGIANNKLGGINVKASLTFTKENGIWYATKMELTFGDICDYAPYKGLNGKAKLYFNGNAAPYTYTKTGKQEIGTELKMQLPSYTTKSGTDAQSNMYLKNAVIEYTEDPTYYLSDFNAKYTAMTDAGITAASTEVTAEQYNTYVAPVWEEYNALNAFLKTYVETEKINTLESIDYVYYVGDKADAFNAAYDKIKGLDASSMSFDEISAVKADIDACRAEYNKLDSTVISYIPSEKLAQLVSLENAYNGYVSRKQSGTFYADFEDNTGSNAALYTSFLNKTYAECAENGITKSAIYGNANQSFNTNMWISGYITDATAANGYASPSSTISIKNGKATQTVNNIKTETSLSAHRANIQRSVLTAVNKDYLPEGINKISFTGDISDLNDTVTSKEYAILYGKNANLTKYKSGDENYSDEPIFGTAVKIDKDGNVTFGIAYYAYVTSTYNNSVRLNHIVTDYSTNIASGAGNIPLTAVTKPGDFNTKTVDVSSGKFNLEIAFNSFTIKTASGVTYAANECYVPTYTMTDGAGNKLIGTPSTYGGNYDSNNARKNNANIFPTEINGLAFGLSVNNPSSSKQELVLDDIYVQGNGANAVTGATILTNNTPEKQDLKFNATLSESNYLKSLGYTVSGYGAIAAVEGQFQGANLSELTVENAESLGEGKAFVYTKDATDGTVPSNLGVVLGNSAAVKGGIGLQYRVRVFVKYTKGDEVKYVYSTNRAEGLMENGQHVRSVYSTAKAIANYVKASGNATYNSFGTDNADAFKTAIENIIAGGKSTEKQTVGTELDNGTILLSFTSENAAVIK